MKYLVDDVRPSLPPYGDIPDEFKHGNAWTRLASSIFFSGADAKKWKEKPGIDKKKALRHVQTVLQSFDPPHEHKIAGVGLLLSEWFEKVE